MSIKKKIVWLPYDMDTAIGINNEGELVFSYELEDTDHLAGGADVYNGQDSVIWNNIRMAFADELRNMYQKLRSEGKLSYETVEKAFEEHQAKWPEALFNEDSQFCYIDPLIYDNKNYLEMLQGSKEEQRKWWLYNRFRYIDSKYNAGDALSDLIQLRSYAKSNITITPYADIYPTVKFGSYLVSKRGKRNVATLLECPVDALNDTETYIYSASQLASVGDLSGLKVGFADFSMAVKLQSLKLGDSSSNYENPNLKVLTLGNNILLQTLDVRNCSALGSGDMKVVDISGCTGIRKVWFTGTQITGLTLPIGGVLDELALPATMTNITVRNQPRLTSFTFTGNSYSAVGTCRIENTDYFLKNQSWFNQILKSQESGGLKQGCRLRLVGLDINWLADTDAISDFYALFTGEGRFRGLDITGGEQDTPYLDGTIHINSAKGSEIARLKQIFPYVNIEAEHTESYIYYYNGSTLVYTEKVLDGGNGTYAGTPTKASDAQYTYTFAGWSKDDDNTVDSDALNNIVADRNVYACFTSTLRKYNVTFVKASADGGGTLQTIQNVNYGTVITAANAYTGATPTTSQGSAEDYPFEGWSPASATVTGNTTFTAMFGSPVEVVEITDSWDTIIANIDNGTYKTIYKVGNYKAISLGSNYQTAYAQIVGFDADTDRAGNTIPISFTLKNVIKKSDDTNYQLYFDKNDNDWESSYIRTQLNTTLFDLLTINNTFGNRITAAQKYTYNLPNDIETMSIDSLWLLSMREFWGGSTFAEHSGPTYKLRENWIENNSYGCFRTTGPYQGSCYFNNGNSFSYSSKRNDELVNFGFCLGLEPETITDDWPTILANENYATDYSIGDTKYLDLGTEGKQLMEIVAFDTDDRADGQGKAGITWISKGLLYTPMPMNATQKTVDGETLATAGGWLHSDMRAYLKNTIKPLIPETVRNAIVSVTKVQSIYTNGERVANGQTTTDDVWIPSAYEIFDVTTYESTGATYTGVFKDADSRIKKRKGVNDMWWLRSVSGNRSFRDVTGAGINNYREATSTVYIALGFCTN